MYKEQGIKKASSPLKDEAVSPCYHLNSQTAHTACLMKYGSEYASNTDSKRYPCLITAACAAAAYSVTTVLVQNSGMYSDCHSLRLSSAGCFL